MLKKLIMLSLAWGMCAVGTFAQEEKTDSGYKFDRGIEKKTFVPKGQWITGGNFSYSEHTNKNYKLAVIEGWNGSGYTLKVSPFVGYAFANDVAAGGRFEYSRSLLKIDELNVDLSSLIDGDMNLNLEDIYQVSHDFYTTGFLRTYINLGDSRRFALFNDVRLSFGYGQGKIVNGAGASLTGTYEKTLQLGIGLTPGLVAFINDFAAVEVNVGVLGFKMKWINQEIDRVNHGYRRTSSANFKIDLFSIGLGIAFYL